MRSGTRYNKWRNILCSPAQNLRNSAELLQFRTLITMDQNSFISTICDLYGDFSDIAAHKILFPIAYDRNSITQMFQDVGLTPDGAKIDSIVAILTPIATPKSQSRKSILTEPKVLKQSLFSSFFFFFFFVALLAYVFRRIFHSNCFSINNLEMSEEFSVFYIIYFLLLRFCVQRFT